MRDLNLHVCQGQLLGSGLAREGIEDRLVGNVVACALRDLPRARGLCPALQVAAGGGRRLRRRGGGALLLDHQVSGVVGCVHSGMLLAVVVLAHPADRHPDHPLRERRGLGSVVFAERVDVEEEHALAVPHVAQIVAPLGPLLKASEHRAPLGQIQLPRGHSAHVLVEDGVQALASATARHVPHAEPRGYPVNHVVPGAPVGGTMKVYCGDGLAALAEGRPVPPAVALVARVVVELPREAEAAPGVVVVLDHEGVVQHAAKKKGHVATLGLGHGGATHGAAVRAVLGRAVLARDPRRHRGGHGVLFRYGQGVNEAGVGPVQLSPQPGCLPHEGEQRPLGSPRGLRAPHVSDIQNHGGGEQQCRHDTGSDARTPGRVLTGNHPSSCCPTFAVLHASLRLLRCV
mmetsp:Transcript_39293/g.117480  ORF Transcript_39293/g.117480 Transcript_39293/m.117480 type:complete len:402 (+) Transcript_39293:505-1710(+)